MAKNPTSATKVRDIPRNFGKYSKEVIRFLQSRYHWSKEDAQTIFNDAYLLSLEHLSQKRIKEITKYYLKSVAQKIGANLSRHHARKPRFVSLVNETIAILDHQLYLEYHIRAFEYDETTQVSQARRAFCLLEDNCQQLINLKYVMEFSHKEIAQKLQITPDSCKTQLSRCLKYWKKWFHSLSTPDND
ncbi:sigma-70 family RNA polymerase sigma factor [Fulvivirga sp. M361]|uniref:RNA polymerase sigma factor n=1 Tax=Fulvivirga sp. M361 TaxID=2594266 RepID=UPI00117A6B9C|nr:sigma-70 family RNA polymerase sigma factor [Fulvivirga sp. M361]TRX47247.1 sigma-70 family RNA polymerase sigma factor [Fulvivirga sp. M361]